MEWLWKGLKWLGQVALGVIGLLVLLGIVGYVIDQKQASANCAGANCGSQAPCAGDNCGTSASAGTQWTVANETDDPLSGHKTITARMSHATADGGEIQIAATCPDRQSIKVEFNSFDRGGKGVAFDYSKDPSPSLIVLYRLDGGHRLLVSDPLSQTQHPNVAEVNFTISAPDATDLDDPNAAAEALGTVGAAGLYGVEKPQDIMAFLGANAVRFEIALDGGSKELMEIDPQDPAFSGFASQCGITLASVKQAEADAQAAHQAQEEQDNADAAEQALADWQRSWRSVRSCPKGAQFVAASDTSLYEDTREGRPIMPVAKGTTMTVLGDATATPKDNEGYPICTVQIGDQTGSFMTAMADLIAVPPSSDAQ